jgi:hypothetical protein
MTPGGRQLPRFGVAAATRPHPFVIVIDRVARDERDSRLNFGPRP